MNVLAASIKAGIPVGTVRARMYNKMMTLEEALVKPPPSKMSRVKAAAKKHGIKPHTLYSRMQRNGYTIAQALAVPFGPRRNPVNTAARKAGITPSTLEKRMRRHHISLSEAVAMGPGKPRRIQPGMKIGRLTVTSITHSVVTARCACGTVVHRNYTTVGNAVRKGFDSRCSRNCNIIN
jgi:transposase-like protein